MKKALKLLLTFLMFISITLPAHAADEIRYTVNVNDLDFSIAIPKYYDVFKQDFDNSVSLLKKYGYTAESLFWKMHDDNSYIMAITADDVINVKVASDTLGVMDFNDMPDDIFDMYLSTFESTAVNSGFTQITLETFATHQLKFIRVKYYDTKARQYKIAFHSTYDGYSYAIELSSRDDITLTQRMEMDEIVESMYIKNFMYKAPVLKQTPPFPYQDSTSQASFTVPENWKIDTSYPPGDVIDTYFKYGDYGVARICFGSFDLYEATPKEERVGIKRKDVNLSIFTFEDMIDSLADAGIIADTVHKENYGNTDYYIAAGTYNSDFSPTQQVTAAYTLIDGIAYNFYFSGWEESRYYSDFISLLESVTYPAPATYDNLFIYIGIAVVAVVAIVIFIFMAKSKKAPAVKEITTSQISVNTVQPEIQPASQPEPQVIYCYKCGAINTADDSFYCVSCGTKLPTVADIEAVEPTETPQQPPRPEKVKVKAVKAKKTDKNK